MWKKTFIRSIFIGMVVLAGLLVFATTRSSKKTPPADCIQSQKECCEKKSQGDFIIWESLSRTVLVNLQY